MYNKIEYVYSMVIISLDTYYNAFFCSITLVSKLLYIARTSIAGDMDTQHITNIQDKEQAIIFYIIINWRGRESNLEPQAPI